MNIRNSQAREDFIAAYITAALWSSTDQDGEPLDNSYAEEHIAPETLAKIRADCMEFMIEAGDNLVGISAESAGHDFWLTRNRHGTGFWDRGYGPLGIKLTNIAQSYGEVDLYVGDDGLVRA